MSGQLGQCWYFMNTASEALSLLFREIKHTQFQMMLWGKEGLCISLCKSPVLGSRTLEVCQLSKQTLLELLRCWIVPGLFSVGKGRFSSQKCQNLSTEYLLYCSCIFLWEKKKLHKPHIWLIQNNYINIVIIQSDISIMITVQMFYRQMPRYSEFEERMTPAEGHSK